VPGRSPGGSRCPCRPARRRDCADDHARTNARGAAGRPVALIPELGTLRWGGTRAGQPSGQTQRRRRLERGQIQVRRHQCVTRIAVVRQTGQRCGGAGDHGHGPQPMIWRVIYEDRSGNVQPRAARSRDQGRRRPVASATAKGVRRFWARRDRKLPVGISIPVAPIVTAAFWLAPA
jgi:hypothetical protein